MSPGESHVASLRVFFLCSLVRRWTGLSHWPWSSQRVLTCRFQHYFTSSFYAVSPQFLWSVLFVCFFFPLWLWRFEALFKNFLPGMAPTSCPTALEVTFLSLQLSTYAVTLPLFIQHALCGHMLYTRPSARPQEAEMNKAAHLQHWSWSFHGEKTLVILFFINNFFKNYVCVCVRARTSARAQACLWGSS